MTLALIYPNVRAISEQEVVQWAFDLMVDAAVEAFERGRGRPLSNEEIDWRAYEHIRSSVAYPSLEEAIILLEDEGKATFRRL